jgi:hypothetical protein
MLRDGIGFAVVPAPLQTQPFAETLEDRCRRETTVLSLFGFENLTELSHTKEHTSLDRLTADAVDQAVDQIEREDRRRTPRLPLPSGAAGTTATGHLVELLNISPGGMLLRSVHPVRPGERHVLRVPDHDLGCVTLTVNVVHAESVAESWGRFVLAGVALAE